MSNKAKAAKSKTNETPASPGTDTAVATVPPVETPAKEYTLFSVAPVNSEATQKMRLLSIQILSPKKLPVGAHFTGKITGFCDSPVSTYKSRLINFEADNGMPFRFPCMAVIARCLNLTDGKKELTVAERTKRENEWLGKKLFVQYTGESTKAEEGKSKTKLYNVAVVED